MPIFILYISFVACGVVVTHPILSAAFREGLLVANAHVGIVQLLRMERKPHVLLLCLQAIENIAAFSREDAERVVMDAESEDVSSSTEGLIVEIACDEKSEGQSTPESVELRMVAWRALQPIAEWISNEYHSQLFERWLRIPPVDAFNNASNEYLLVIRLFRHIGWSF